MLCVRHVTTQNVKSRNDLYQDVCNVTPCISTILYLLTYLIYSLDPATYPPKEERKVAFACQNSYIHLSCKNANKRIRILLANYGRFSLVVCNQAGVHKGWNVQCSSKISMEVVRER